MVEVLARIGRLYIIEDVCGVSPEVS